MQSVQIFVAKLIRNSINYDDLDQFLFYWSFCLSVIARHSSYSVHLSSFEVVLVPTEACLVHQEVLADGLDGDGMDSYHRSTVTVF